MWVKGGGTLGESTFGPLPQIEAVGPLSKAGGNTLDTSTNRLAFGLNFPTFVPVGQSRSTENFHKTLIIVVGAETGNVESSRSWYEAREGHSGI